MTTTTVTNSPDFHVHRSGSLFLFEPQNDDAEIHLKANTGGEAQWFSGALVVERCYARELADRLIEEGFLVR